MLAHVAAILLCGCTDPAQRAQVVVVVDADAAVRELVDELQTVVEVQATGSGSWETRDTKLWEPKVLGTWPIEFTIDAREADQHALFQVTATARDRNYAIVGLVRARRQLSGGTRLTLRALLEVECAHKQLCERGKTCKDGACVDANYDGGELVRNDGPLSDGSGEPSGTPDTVVMAGDACPSEGARGCAPPPAQVPVVCASGAWQEQQQCNDDEMCDGSVGMCRPIAHECEGRAPDVPFCEQDEMRVCETKFRSVPRTCEQNEVCKMLDEEAKCDCDNGFVRTPTGCEEATDCTTNRGGCDPLTECRMQSGTRTCTDCPPGYVGTGLEGCEPLLAGILPSAGTLRPAFDPNTSEYRIDVPLLVQRLTLKPSAAADARIKLNGAALPESGSWTTPTLPLGEYTIELSLTAPSGSMRAYKIVVSRAGTQAAYIKTSNSEADDHLGMSIAMDGDTLVASSMFEDSAAREVNGDQANDDAADSGAVYVFVRRGAAWEQQAYLKANDSVRGMYFGSSVAIHRDTIVVGAIRDNVLAPTNARSEPGIGYIFTRTGETWAQTARLQRSTGMDADWFGFISAIENDTIVVGAPRHGGDGAAFVFTRNGDEWSEQQRLVGMGVAAQSGFGSFVAISGDTIVVGAPDDDVNGAERAGSVTVFTRRDGMWVAQQRLIASQPAQNASFGYALGVANDTIMVGAPRIISILTPFTTTAGEVFVFERNGEKWEEVQILKAMVPRASDSFGSSVSLRSDAALIGACGDASGARGVGSDASRRDSEYSGAAYLYAREGQAWRPSVYLKPSNTERDDMFGFQTVLSDQAAAVSAIWEASDAQGIGGNESNNGSVRSGALYVFQ